MQVMLAGQNQHEPIARFETRREIEQDHSHLSKSQRAAVEQILSSRDQVTALEGVAGPGKTTSLVAIRETAERAGHAAQGVAPATNAVWDNLAHRNMQRSTEPGEPNGAANKPPTRHEPQTENATHYASNPDGPKPVPPDNQPRREINKAIHRTMQSKGQVEIK